jgi:hypothetical protein
LIRDEIVPTRWGEFRRKFIRELKLCFNAICESDYDPAMVDEVNQRLNELLGKFVISSGQTHGSAPTVTTVGAPRWTSGRPVVSFVLKPETAEDRSSLKNLTIMNGIWMRWTGVPLDFSQFIKPEGASPICRQMEMYLELSIMPHGIPLLGTESH